MRFALVRETFEYEIPLRDANDNSEVEGAIGRIDDFAPDSEDVRLRAQEFGCEMTSHRVEVAAITNDFGDA